MPRLKIPFLQYAPPIEPFVILKGGWTAEECKKIHDLASLYEFTYGAKNARVGSGQGSVENEKIRKTDLIWLEPELNAPQGQELLDKTRWIFDRVNELGCRINHDKFQLDLLDWDTFQYTKYLPEHHYDWHSDTITNPPDGLFRKLTLVSMLSDPSEYEGGQLLLNSSGSNQDDEKAHYRLKLEQGDVVAFYSFMSHKVEPVTSGKRVTLVTWARGEKFR